MRAYCGVAAYGLSSRKHARPAEVPCCCLQQVLAMAEIREDVEQQLRRIEGRRQLLAEQKVAEQRRLIRLLDAQLKEACEGCNAQERELKDLVAEVLGQLHAYTGALLPSHASCRCGHNAVLTRSLKQQPHCNSNLSLKQTNSVADWAG